MDGRLEEALDVALRDLPCGRTMVTSAVSGVSRSGKASLRLEEAVQFGGYWAAEMDAWLTDRAGLPLHGAAYVGHRHEVVTRDDAVFIDSVLVPARALELDDEHSLCVMFVRLEEDLFDVQFQTDEDAGLREWSALGHPALSPLVHQAWRAELNRDPDEGMVFETASGGALASFLREVERIRPNRRRVNGGSGIPLLHAHAVGPVSVLTADGWASAAQALASIVAALADDDVVRRYMPACLAICSSGTRVLVSVEVHSTPVVGPGIYSLDVCGIEKLRDGRCLAAWVSDRQVRHRIRLLARAGTPSCAALGCGARRSQVPIELERITEATRKQLVAALEELPLRRAEGIVIGDSADVVSYIERVLVDLAQQVHTVSNHRAFGPEGCNVAWQAGSNGGFLRVTLLRQDADPVRTIALLLVTRELPSVFRALNQAQPGLEQYISVLDSAG